MRSAERAAAVRRARGGAAVFGPQDVWELSADFRGEVQECVAVFCLDAAHRLICRKIVSIGTLTESLVHPREIFAPAIEHRSAAVIVAHNHPSGTAAPSGEDAAVTRRLSEAGRLLGIPLLDHVVVTADGWARAFP